MLNFLSKRTLRIWLTSFVLGVIPGVYLLGKDIIYVLIPAHLTVVIFQNLLFFLFIWQVLSYKPIYILTAVRNKSDYVDKELCLLVCIETVLFFIGYYGAYFLGGYPAFIYGSVVIGTILLLVRFFIILFSGFLLVGLFQHFHHAYILIIAILIANIMYHYLIEYQLLLPLYTPYHY